MHEARSEVAPSATRSGVGAIARSRCGPQLTEAVETLPLGGMNVSIYNHQLCTMPRAFWPFARKSISDWKNVYLPQCAKCGVSKYSGGFFQSATKRHSSAIAPIAELGSAMAEAMDALYGAVDIPH